STTSRPAASWRAGVAAVASTAAGAADVQADVASRHTAATAAAAPRRLIPHSLPAHQEHGEGRVIQATRVWARGSAGVSSVGAQVRAHTRVGAYSSVG